MHQINQRFTMSFDYPVCFTRGALAIDNLTLRDVLARAGTFPHKVQPVIDAEVLHHHPQLIQQLEDYGRAHSSVMELVMPPLIVRGGEICKNDPTEVEEFYRLTQEHSICRHSFALVIGGGSVIDAIGYAAAVTHRGIRLIRMPTTVLAQNDAGIGVKNAINYHNRKNYLGTFAPPFAVLNDFDFLRSLPKEDQRAGMAEAVKVGLIRDGEFFEWLHAQRQVLAAFNDDAVEYMITRCAELHLQHISTSGDPFEQGSARPLDFGHWAAHRLEELSHSALRHGEAVAIGIALDSYYSHALGMIDDSTLDRILATLRDIGFTLYHPALEQLDIYRALEDFREHLGGRLCITLLTAAGSAREVDEIQLDVMQDCVNQLRKYCGEATSSGGLTYCTNIHPGESWADVMENLNAHVPAVKKACSPDKPFPLGLRISHQAAMEIGTEELKDFRQWCSKHDCYLLTVNGFPYGAFHGEVVKEQVYQPDWRTRERVIYTKRLADLAVAMMTQPTELSISTVPIAFKPDFQVEDWPLVRVNLIDALRHLAQIQQQSGVTVRLALEPEPGCVLEVMDEVLDFFARLDFPAELRKFIGLCFDACHQAVEFEDPAACLTALADANIPVIKVQVSSALRATGEEIQRLINFDEPTYLHQAVALEDGKLAGFNDLSELDTYLCAGHQPQECRVHFHVPIFIDHLGDCGTTRFFLEDLLPRLDPRIPLEVETYSFGVLPEHLRRDSTHASIVRELNWVTAQLNADKKGA